MKTQHWLGGIVFIGMVIVTAFVMKPNVGNTKPEPTAPKEVAKPQQAADTPPTLPALEPFKDGDTEAHFTGSVVSDRKATLSARMPARIMNVSASEGTPLTLGQVVIQLDDSDIQGQVRTSFAAVQTALTQITRATEGKKAQLLKADTDIATARSGLKQAEIKLQQATLAKDALQGDTTSEKKLAEEAVKKAEIGYDQAVRTRKSLEALSGVGGVSRNDLQSAVSAEKAAYSDLQSAQTQRNRLNNGVTPETTYRIALANKDIETAQAGVHQAEEGVQLAEKAKERIRDVAEQEINTAKAGLEQAKVGWQVARESTDSMRLHAPFAGVATAINAKPGEMAQPGMPLLTVVSLEGLRVDALVTARHLARLKVGLPATVQVDTLPNRKFEARVAQIASSAESDGRTFRVQFRFASPVTLLPGQVAHVRLSFAKP